MKTELFVRALINDRPVFVDYFLRKQYNILETREFLTLKNKSNVKTTEETNTRQNNQTPTVDDQRKDYVEIRAACARKFIIEELYMEKFGHLEVNLFQRNLFFLNLRGPPPLSEAKKFSFSIFFFF